MSEARVYVNGKEACFWPFGYNSFHCDITELLHKEGKDNVLAVTPGKPSSIFPLVSGSWTLPECPSHYCRKNTCTGMGYTDYHPTRC